MIICSHGERNTYQWRRIIDLKLRTWYDFKGRRKSFSKIFWNKYTDKDHGESVKWTLGSFLSLVLHRLFENIHKERVKVDSFAYRLIELTSIDYFWYSKKLWRHLLAININEVTFFLNSIPFTTYFLNKKIEDILI